MTNKERYEICKRNGICVSCHKNKAEQGKVVCQECKEKRKAYNRQFEKETNEWYSSKGICIVCHTENAQKGHKLCFRCLADKREKNKPDRRCRNQYVKERYKRLKENGICVVCGKKEATAGVRCLECNIKNIKSDKERRLKSGTIPRSLMGNGEYCSTCGKPTENGNKLCERCYKNSLQNIKKAQENPPKDNYFKRLNNTFWRERTKGKIKEI